MAKSNNSIGGVYRKRNKTRRPGVHAKKKSSKNKHSKNYKKPYKSQGR